MSAEPFTPTSALAPAEREARAQKAATQAAGVEKGSSTTPVVKAGTVTADQVRAIAEQKMPDLNAIDLEGAIAQVAGTARSMGLDIVD